MNPVKSALNRGKTPLIYYYRDSNGNEVDLLEKRGSVYDCFEIKSSMTYHSDFTIGLERFKCAFPELAGNLNVVYAGDSLGAINGIEVQNYRHIR